MQAAVCSFAMPKSGLILKIKKFVSLPLLGSIHKRAYPKP